MKLAVGLPSRPPPCPHAAPKGLGLGAVTALTAARGTVAMCARRSKPTLRQLREKLKARAKSSLDLSDRLRRLVFLDLIGLVLTKRNLE